MATFFLSVRLTVGYEGTYLKGGEVWVVMENMPCGSLADLIEAHDVCPMREREIAFATKQLLMVTSYFVICVCLCAVYHVSSFSQSCF